MYIHDSTDLQHISTVRHESKLIRFGVKAIATDETEEEYYGELYYSILETGEEPEEDTSETEEGTDESSTETAEEDTIEELEVPGHRWSAWKLLALPNYEDDVSVLEQEAAEAEAYWNSLPEEERIPEAKEEFLASQPPVRSRYRTATEGAFAPIQTVSTEDFLYIFRQSLSGTLLADRFVLDGVTNELIPKLEVRFRRSRQKHTPLNPSKNGQNFDAKSYRDADGNFFYEPSKELSIVGPLYQAWFSVVMTPTYEHDKFCWHFFYYNAMSDQMELLSLRRSADGWFDLNDYLVTEGDAEDPDYRLVPGIIHRQLNILDDSHQAIKVVDGFSASMYCLQDKATNEDGEEILLKAGVRVMLAFPSSVDRRCATINFSVHRDGTLSRIANNAVAETRLRETKQEVLLPGNLLNQLQPYAAGEYDDLVTNERNGLTFSGLERVEIEDPFTGKALKTFSIAAWLRPSSLAHSQSVGIFGDGPDSSDKPSLFLDSDGKLSFAAEGTDGQLHDGYAADLCFTNADEWVHIAWVKTSEHFFLYRDGELTDTFDAPAKINTQEGPHCIGQAGTSRASWNGEIAAFSSWKKALSAEEVANLMESSPLASQADLTGFWPLEAVTDGATTDFSPYENHGTVVGAYPAGSHFSQQMTDNSPVESYRHDELVGVSQRGTYIESVEYQCDDIDKTPHTLQFVVWGTQGRNGETIAIDVDDLTTYVEELEDGWRRVSTRFTIPDGMSHLRYCEIQKPEGNWTHLKLRRHDMYQIAKTITQAEYQDEIVLQPLGDVPDGDNFQDLNQMRQELTELEIQESAKLQRLAYLDSMLGMDPALAVATLETEVQDLYDLVGEDGSLTEEKADLHKVYTDELHDPFNYYLSFTTLHSGRSGEMLSYRSTKDLDVKGSTSRSREYKWKILRYAGYHRLQSKDNPDLYMTKKDGGELDIQVRTFKSEDRQRWIVDQVYSDVYRILARWNNDKCAHLYSKNGNVYTAKYGNHTNQHWRIKKHGHCNDRIDEAKIAYDTICEVWNDQYDLYIQKQQDLLNSSGWSAERDQLLADLLVLQDRIAELNGLFLSSADVLGNEVLELDRESIGFYSDENGLVTTAALLDFAKCQGRVSLYESLAGRVQLDFFMESGAMRSCYYDAITEQWRPNLLLSCIDFNGGTDVARVEEITSFPAEEMTFEFWAKSAEAIPSGTLLSYFEPNSGDHFSISDTETGLAITFNGASLETKAPFHDTNWHHYAINMYGGEKVLRVYRDGELFDSFNVPVNEIASGGTLTFGQEQNTDTATDELYVPDHAFRGKIANVRLWSAALSADEIVTQRHFHLAGYEPELVAYWPMSEATGNEFRDHSLNGMDGTLEGGAQWFAGTMPIGQLPQTVLDVENQDAYLKSSQEVLLNEQGYNFSIEFWARRNQNSAENQIVFAHGVGGSKKGFKLGFDTAGKFYFNILSVGTITMSTMEADHFWHHYALTYNKVDQKLHLFQDGQIMVEAIIAAENIYAFNDSDANWDNTIYVGCRGWDQQELLEGQVSDVRIWEGLRSQDEIVSLNRKRLTGKEPGLLLYWPLDEQDATTGEFQDLVGENHAVPQQVDDSAVRTISTSVLSLAPSDALLSGEYAAMQTDRQGKIFTLLRKLYFFGVADKVKVLTSTRIEELERRWLGNAQFAPTLLGYMEGAPPVPSENLTEETDYRGATSVELQLSEDTTYRWERSQQAGVGWNMDGGMGWASNTSLGVGIGPVSGSESVSTEFLAKGTLNGQYSWLHDSEIESQVGLNQSHRLALKGKKEADDAAEITEVGSRYIPKNVGYAAVVSSLADVFVFRLRRSGIMVGYEVTPVADIPPDINTITFMMNPAYTMNGTLDGQVGMQAADDLFYSHVPDMRSQYGSLYPASYYRLKEAYELKQMIQEEDSERESLYMNYNSNLVDEGYLSSKSESKEVSEGDAEDSLEEVDQNVVESSSNSSGELESWQEKMEALALKAQKQNIVNTYVWDGDGGLRSETQQFSSTIQQTIGGSFSLDGGLGFTGSYKGGTLGYELTFLATFHLTQTMKKSETVSKGFSLNVTVDCENEGITDQRDFPLNPGQKVDRYRFMSFYLAPKTDHFNHFFENVVDPEWLMSNDEEARTLREIDQTAPNKTWKVMHRVTYVERPALSAIS